LVSKPEGKSLLRRLGHRWEDNIKIKEVSLEGVNYIDLVQDSDW
jgi:hypothetical protein